MKKGFTLIEMIGVMVILSLLMLFAMPNVINYIKNGGDTEDKVIKTMIYEASKKYITDNQSLFKKDKKNTYCISVSTLAKEGYVEAPIKLPPSDEDITSETSTKAVKVTYNKEYEYELTDNCIGIVNPTPMLYSGLTPVMYDGENWKVVDKNDSDWYNYDEQKWANAVVLGEGKTKNPGDIVTVEGENPDALMMLVWIPRYEYKYTNLENQYAGGTQVQPEKIEINFVGKNVTTSSNDTQYKVHPAFTFGDKNVSGFWVGKFEISHIDQMKSETNMNCATDTCSEAQYLRILPNKSSLRNNTVSSFFYGIKSMGNINTFGLSTMNVHMMKNSEWGAVAYLSQSKYGKYGNNEYNNEYKEIYQNKSSNYITGLSNGTPSQEGINTQCAYNDMSALGEGKGVCGPGASTTGNIYGVYDMSGGSNEYVMGVYGPDYPTIGSSNFGNTVFTNSTIESKYYDIYTTNNSITECNNNGICYGHGLSETANWYGDSSDMVNSNYPWFLRGGYYNSNIIAGVFHFNRNDGNSYVDSSARVVGFGK